MENKLTIETIEAAVKDLEQKRKEYDHEVELGGHKFKFIKRDILTGMQMIITSGDKAYYSPDITSGEVKVIDLPDPWEFKPVPPEWKYWKTGRSIY